MTRSNVRVIETLSTFTPLGIRFWDSVLDEQVRGGLHVTARPASTATSRPRSTAFRTKSDIYAFGHLSGLDVYERGQRDPLEQTSPTRRRPFIIEVTDTHGRYLDVAFRTDLPLPYRGVFLSGPAASPDAPLPQGFFLYSAPGRVQPAWLAWVRGQLSELRTGSPRPEFAPAPHALVQVEDPDGNLWFGISDSNGVFVVLLPYPTIAEGFAGSPLIGGETPLHARTWDLRVSVRYRPDTVERLPFTDVPEYHSILSQTGASVWPVHPDDGGTAGQELSGTLEYGRVLTVRTEGLSELLVSPEPTSP